MYVCAMGIDCFSFYEFEVGLWNSSYIVTPFVFFILWIIYTVYIYIITGVISMSGHLFPFDVYAWVAVFVIPVNAALNPFLYTFNNIKKKSVNTSVQVENKKRQQVGSFPRS